MERIKLESGKKVLMAEPYEPPKGSYGEFVGRDRELRMILSAWMSGGSSLPMSPLLVGAPGLGKNRIVYELSRQLKMPLYIFQGHADVSADELACSVRFSDEPQGGMDYVLSSLTSGLLQENAIVYIDEIGKIGEKALSILVSLMDERRYLDSQLLGERVHARPGFRLIAATNTGEVSTLPEYIQSRMRPVIRIGPPPKEEYEQIVDQHIRQEPKREELLRSFWRLWKASKRQPSPREANHHFSLAVKSRDLEEAMSRGIPVADAVCNHKPSRGSVNRLPLEPHHLEDAFSQLAEEDAA